MTGKLDTQTGRVELRKGRSSDESLSVLVAGDFCPRMRTDKLIRAGKSAEILQDIAGELRNKDLSLVSLEVPLTRARTATIKTGPNLKADPDCVDFLKQAGFDIALLANNHIGDFGPKPVLETIGTCRRNGIRTVGAGPNIDRARKPLFIRRNGIRLAVLNYAENEFGGARRGHAGASTLDPLENIREIRDASQKADVTLVVIHGGIETNPIPNPRQMQIYRAFAEAGASAVVGAHTHCPQGIEVRGGTPIAYSLGNFLFDLKGILPYDEAATHKDFWWTGYMLRIDFDKKGARAVEVVPYTFGPTAERIVPLRGEAKRRFLRYLATVSHIAAKPREVERYWDAWCVQAAPGWIPYFKKATWPPKGRKEFWNTMVLRNAFTCEAHSAACNRFLRLVEERRLTAARKAIPALKALQVARL